MAYTDASVLTPGLVYTYRVAAVNAGGTSPYSHHGLAASVPTLPGRAVADVRGGREQQTRKRQGER